MESCNKMIDLIHDDWFGLAPLASPESLSEVSSISSRASFGNLERIQALSSSYELKTPKVMRRTPKIVSNLSTCADDIKSVRTFQKLGQSKYLRRPSTNGSSITNSSSNLSFESASSGKFCSHEEDASKKCCEYQQEDKIKECFTTSGESDDFQSAENILDSVIESAGCSDFFNSKSSFMETHFDESMFENEPAPAKSNSASCLTPQLLLTVQNDPDLITNFAIDLTLDEEHRSQISRLSNVESKTNSVDSGSVCRTPSEAKYVTFNPQVVNIESLRASPVGSPRGKKSDRWHLLPRKNQKVKAKEMVPRVVKPEQVPKTILCSKRRNSDEDFFSRTEALPLLSGLSSVSERTSPSFVRRKKYVYPTVTVVKSESSV